ncbi:MAG TPA: glycosyltransferase family 4 protein [Gemmatimonadaceae bacterium]|nr:glycosyltransferase family 4 protein [Gemmatimonadaceae bacterium]
MAADAPGLVLLSADTLGGVWTYAVELSAALGARGLRVALATMGAPLTEAQRAQLAPLRDRVTLYESAYRLEWQDSPWDDVARAGDWLRGLERELRPDVVHLNQFAFGALDFHAPTLLVAHSCVCSWWEAVHHEPAPPSWDPYRDVVRAGVAGADLVGAPTQAMLRAVQRLHGLTASGVVLPNGRNGALFAPGEKEPFILAAGRMWDDAKNLVALDAVAASLPWPVRIAGPTAGPDGAARTAWHAELLGTLTTPELAAELARASIYASPARYEPFGLSVLEAGLAACALVLGDLPSLREVWGDAAIYVGPDDHDALAATLYALSLDPPRRRRLGAAARQRALHFTPRRMADAYLRAYAGAATARARRRAAQADRAAQEAACAS